MAQVASVSQEMIVREIKDFVRESSANRLHLIDNTPIFDEPLVAFADGDDPLFTDYKRVIGDFHLTPREALAHAGDVPASEPVGVISWVLPIMKTTRESNRAEKLEPSDRWVYTRWYGEILNDKVKAHVASWLAAAGYVATAPGIEPYFQRLDLLPGPTSNWSERHIAYAAGLGTFSLSDGFITPRGIAIRVGSVIANIKVEPSPRRYASHLDNCLFYHNQRCRKCIDRCPIQAISDAGHDKIRCYYYTKDVFAPLKKHYQVGVVGCGLCQANVPCESLIPVKSNR